jgi:hypothetical protein
MPGERDAGFDSGHDELKRHAAPFDLSERRQSYAARCKLAKADATR